jgi:phosphatidylserine decarboxylase
VGGGLTILLLFLLQFYRDPERTAPPEGATPAVLSPADGRVVDVHKSPEALHISIFMSPLDVHVNRAPVSGRVVELSRAPGRFLPAFAARASAENERVCLRIDSPAAGAVACTQVAGILARRIDNWIEVGQTVTRGQRYGMIHLGSRVDLALAPAFDARVRAGDRVKAGATVLAERTAG